jgi:hypothetical protein
VTKSKVLVPAIVGVSTFFIGVGVGYALHKFKTRSRVVETITKAEDPEVFQQELPFDEGPRTVLRFEAPKVEEEESIVQEAEEEYYVPPEEDDDKGDYLVNPLRGVENDEWIWEHEIERRNAEPGRPYVIHYNEYSAQELDYPQESVMYYEGDDVVCDSKDEAIYAKDRLMGPLLFGHGSLDPNVVYIRNEKIEMEWEVLRNPGHFGIEVEGLEEEPTIQHGRNRKKKKEPLPKFRMD